MIFVVGAFLYNALCVVPCQPPHSQPQPIPVIVPYSIQQWTPERTISSSSSSRNVHRSIPHRQQYPHSTPKISPHNGTLSSTVKIPILKSPYVVSIQSGKVEGFPMKTVRLKNIVAFTNIPYAEKPVGHLRYRDPVPKKPWSGILKATTTSQDCLQVDGMKSLRIVGSLDCLYLNVFTPALPLADEMSKMKVIVYIHGGMGSFAFGSGSNYGPAYLLEKDVVLVTFNYRLSSVGFLSTGNSAAPGNFGLKDQLVVLQWVKANIASFGGDPNNVILVGQSAGAVSVHLHFMSKLSRGLFHAGISQSSNAFSYWAVRQVSIEFTYRLANSLRCPVNDSHALVECMRNTDPHLIAYHEATLPEYKKFGPVVEHEWENAFLTERPEKLYELNMVSKVPWINGFLAGEGNGVSFLTWLYPFVMQEVDLRWSELGPKILDIKGEPGDTSAAAAYIKNFYFGHNAINFNTRNRFSQMVGDRLVVAAVYKGLRYHSGIARTYGYFLNFTGKYGTASIYGLRNKDWGVSHDDDLIYLFNNTKFEALKAGEPEFRFSQFLVNLWTNFAEFREPLYTSEKGTTVRFWKPVNVSSGREMQVLLLNGYVPKMIDVPFRNRIRFWERLNLVSNSDIIRFHNGTDENSNKKRIIATSNSKQPK